MKLSSHKKISPRSRSSKMQYVTCQNGYRPLPHWVAQFRMEWTYVNIDGMTTVTLQTKYDPTLPSGYPKVAYSLEMSSESGIYSAAVSHLPGAQHRPRSYRPTTSMLFTVTSSPGHMNHVATIMTLFFIYRILKSLLPQNNAFFIATASVVEDAVDSPDCQGFREQWYYLRFYVRRTMPPTVMMNWWCKGQRH